MVIKLKICLLFFKIEGLSFWARHLHRRIVFLKEICILKLYFFKELKILSPARLVDAFQTLI